MDHRTRLNPEEHRTLGTFPTAKACEAEQVSHIKSQGITPKDSLGAFYRYQCEMTPNTK